MATLIIDKRYLKVTIIPGSQKKRCRNCFGTGTVFGHKKTLIIGGRKCPVCKGACWVPSEFPCQ